MLAKISICSTNNCEQLFCSHPLKTLYNQSTQRCETAKNIWTLERSDVADNIEIIKYDIMEK